MSGVTLNKTQARLALRIVISDASDLTRAIGSAPQVINPKYLERYMVDLRDRRTNVLALARVLAMQLGERERVQAARACARANDEGAAT